MSKKVRFYGMPPKKVITGTEYNEYLIELSCYIEARNELEAKDLLQKELAKIND